MQVRPQPPRSRLVIAVMLAVIACLTAIAPAQDAKEPSGSALGLKRVELANDAKLAELLKTEDALVEVPLPVGNARLNRIAAAAGGRNAPRLVKAVYRAELQGNQLVQGTGLWAIEHSNDASPASAILPLPGLNLALE